MADVLSRFNMKRVGSNKSRHLYKTAICYGIPLAVMVPASAAHAQQSGQSMQLPAISVEGAQKKPAYATQAQYHTTNANLGPLGKRKIADTPASITTVPGDLIVNTMVTGVNQALSYLPSVEIRDQQGFEVSRPQSRGFQSSIVQNTRLDGLNVIGTTAIATENLSGIQVLNGLAGALYGPESPSGVFNYMLAQPTVEPLLRLNEGFQTNGVFTEHADAGGTTADGKVGYRLNLLQSNGQSYVKESNIDRTLGSALLDFHLDSSTTLETYYGHYSTSAMGLPGAIVYDGASTGSGKSSVLPKAPDATRMGIGQPGAGPDLVSDTGMLKLTHDFGNGWTFTLGGLYENAIRNLWGISNTFTDNSGDFTVTKNFTAVPRFTIWSNEAELDGKVNLFGLENDIAFGSNGFINGQYADHNSIAVTLGKSSLADPVVFPASKIPLTGGQYESGRLFEQSIIAGDMIHLNNQWAVQGVFNVSFLNSTSWSGTGKRTSYYAANGAFSPTVSVIYKPRFDVTTYVTWAQSIEQGDQAPASGVVNPSVFMSPYHDTQVEVGVKYAVTPNLLLTVDGFRMTRPSAQTVPVSPGSTSEIFKVVGQQKNYGFELFAQGAVTPDLSVLGGLTYIDARILGTGVPATDDSLVVGVPNFKSDLSFDYHPAFWHGLAGTLAVHYEGRRAATDTNNSYAPQYATLPPRHG